MNENFFDWINNEIKKASMLIRNGRLREALNILNRCMRRLESFVNKAKGADRLRAIALMKVVGQIQTEISEKQMKNAREDTIDEKELINL